MAASPPLHDAASLEKAGPGDALPRAVSPQPSVVFDADAEARLRRKIDLHVIPPVALIYIWCFIDRTNIGNARLAGLERDLGLQNYDYNTLLSVFYVSYIIFEIPLTVLCKRVGPGRFLPAACFAFGLLSMCTAFVTSAPDPFGAGIAVRFLLGVAEAPVFPSIGYYLSRWYRKEELTLRLAGYLVCAPLAGAVGGLLASAILTLDSIGMYREWQMIFLVEGIITMGVGIATYFLITDRIGTASWLTPEEKALAEARIVSENPASAVLDKVRASMVLKGIFSQTTIFAGLIFLLNNTTVQGIALFTPTVIRTLFPGRTVVQQQLLSVPPYICGAAAVLLVPYYFMHRPRWISIVGSSCLVVVSYAIFLGTESGSARYAATFLGAVGAFVLGPTVPGWSAVNSANDSQRAGAISSVIALGNCGGLIATWSYLPRHAPNYVPGNALNLACGALIIILTLMLTALLTRENARRKRGDRDYRLESLSPEQEELLAHQHPRFRLRV
ncbi:MFS general substrate transporter [Tilletiopsis washingtonensis]|uniref:MFS general substrate transporter n=1 Tax=Tilletiopsis washingtonensis TaxID=58919 RepID=A0A316ZAB1_9BASI|nr:MFS general substrate transporter [Tilletiopsis washingtonensis]PWN97948.1 MFS general substrate transporter [Tilletiopsis washingtonensis]